MLNRYSGKKVRLTTNDGEVFTGVAEAYPAGYGLHTFDRAEESVEVDDTVIFRSEIASIELPEDAAAVRPELYNALAGVLLEQPCWIADILPAQVPRDAPGQYFAVDRYFRKAERMAALHRKQAEILLRLNCYDDMAVTFDGGERWELNPDPEAFADALAALSGNRFLRAMFYERRTMIDIEPEDTWMTVCSMSEQMVGELRRVAAAEGLFVWKPEEA